MKNARLFALSSGFSTAFALGATFLATSCGSTATVDQKDLNESTYFGNYTVKFDAETGALERSTRLTGGGISGSTVRLTSPTTANGQDLAVNTNYGTSYRLKNQQAQPEALYTFQWKKKDGSVVTNKLTMVQATSILAPSNGSVFSKSSGTLTVAFDGGLPGNRETVTAELKSESSDSKNKNTYAISSSSLGNQITFSKSDLDKFANGPAFLTVERSRHEDAQQGHEQAGSIMTSEYKSKRVHISIVD